MIYLKNIAKHIYIIFIQYWRETKQCSQSHRRTTSAQMCISSKLPEIYIQNKHNNLA